MPVHRSFWLLPPRVPFAMEQRTADHSAGPPEATEAQSPKHKALPRLAVLLSGSGRTLTNLLAAIGEGRLRASIELVIASRECAGAERARQAGIRTIVVPGEISGPDLEQLLAQASIDWVVLAGYLRLLNIPPAWHGRVVNIHPALLPQFGGPGMFGPRVHEAVIRSGATVSGCTVHLCDENYDTGRILLQKRCDVRPDDTPESLAARIFELECQAYPEALAQLLESPSPQASDAGGSVITTRSEERGSRR